jgi:hypothetical protein
MDFNEDRGHDEKKLPTTTHGKQQGISLSHRDENDQTGGQSFTQLSGNM